MVSGPSFWLTAFATISPSATTTIWLSSAEVARKGFPYTFARVSAIAVEILLAYSELNRPSSRYAIVCGGLLKVFKSSSFFTALHSTFAGVLNTRDASDVASNGVLRIPGALTVSIELGNWLIT